MSRYNDLKGRSSMSQKKAPPGYIWLLAGLGIGLFVALLVYLDKQPEEKISFKEAVLKELDKSRMEQKRQHPNKTGTDKTAKSTDKKKEPRFDFYTILPELEVFIPESEIESDDKKTHTGSATAPTIEPGSNKQYILQIASFRNLEDADKLKANLALLGSHSTIQTVTINGEKWHRVRLGPFHDTNKLQQTLTTLKQNDIHAIVMELK